jgi:hypothetical protein
MHSRKTSSQKSSKYKSLYQQKAIAEYNRLPAMHLGLYHKIQSEDII